MAKLANRPAGLFPGKIWGAAKRGGGTNGRPSEMREGRKSRMKRMRPEKETLIVDVDVFVMECGGVALHSREGDKRAMHNGPIELRRLWQ